MSQKGTVMAIVNQKGGVGKTMTTENFGIGLSQCGKKVLMVDCDPQASLSIALGNDYPEDLDCTLPQLMEKIIAEKTIEKGDGILHHEEGIDLIPADISLSGLEASLVNTMSRETILKQYLENVKGDYEYVLLDCSPSLGMITINALAAADSVLIPVQPQYLSAKGLEQLLQTINKENRCSKEAMEIIMEEDKKAPLNRVVLDDEVIRKYFPKTYTTKQMEDTIIKLLDQWQKKRERDQER